MEKDLLTSEAEFEEIAKKVFTKTASESELERFNHDLNIIMGDFSEILQSSQKTS